jgi:hypothetical protein
LEVTGGRKVEGNQSPSTPNALRLNSVEGVEGKTGKNLFVGYFVSISMKSPYRQAIGRIIYLTFAGKDFGHLMQKKRWTC